MIKPTFFVIGAHKAGTTSLCDLLGQHPDVFMSPDKEPGYFTMRYQRGPDWYASHFADATGHLAIGEGSTSYSVTGVFPETVDRIADYAPHARLIYIVRHPLRRLESAWMQWRSDTAVRVPPRFDEALRRVPWLLDSALYWKQLENYRGRFDDDRILVLFFEEFQEAPVRVVQRTYRFLGVDADFEPQDADRPRNPWQGKSEDSRLLHALRAIPAYERIRDAVVPRSVRRVLKPIFRRSIQARPTWDAATRNYTLERIGPDLERFRRAYDQCDHYWDLETDSEMKDA